MVLAATDISVFTLFDKKGLQALERTHGNGSIRVRLKKTLIE
jgi:hypothetical protein